MDTQEYVSTARLSREEGARLMLAALDAGEEYEGETADDAIDNLPLSVDIVRHVVIVLSTGGPHEELDVELDQGGDIRNITFLAMWGSESQSTYIGRADALWTLAERYVEMMVDQ